MFFFLKQTSNDESKEGEEYEEEKEGNMKERYQARFGLPGVLYDQHSLIYIFVLSYSAPSVIYFIFFLACFLYLVT